MAVEVTNKYNVRNSLGITVIRKDGIQEFYGEIANSSWGKCRQLYEDIKMNMKKAYFFARRWAIRIERKIKHG